MSSSFPDIEILYEEGPCLVVNKPGGLLTQAPPGIDSMELRIKKLLKVRENKPGKVYLGVPHRLDRPASGVMVFAKHVRAARRISEQFQERTVKKTYWTLVEGHVPEDEGTWTDSMRKMPDKAMSEIVAERHGDGQRAILHFKVKQRFDSVTWLEINLETGRTHQIRLQTSSRGFPILGDEMYGGTVRFGPPTHDVRMQWIALHASRLQLKHPMSKEPIDITGPLPTPWHEVAGIG